MVCAMGIVIINLQSLFANLTELIEGLICSVYRSISYTCCVMLWGGQFNNVDAVNIPFAAVLVFSALQDRTR